MPHTGAVFPWPELAAAVTVALAVLAVTGAAASRGTRPPRPARPARPELLCRCSHPRADHEHHSAALWCVATLFDGTGCPCAWFHPGLLRRIERLLRI